MLDVAQLQGIGQSFVDTLLVMKHNGAVDKCRDALFMVASRCAPTQSQILVSLP